MIRPSWLALAAVACATSAPPPGGTSVGNPGKNELRLAPPTEITVETASAVGVTSDLLGCDGVRAALVTGETVDLVGGPPAEVAGGSWCGVTLYVERLALTGASGETAITVALEPPVVWTLWTADPVVVDDTDYVLEIGAPGWVSAAQVPPDGDLAGAITPESEIAPQLLQNLEVGTGWYEDDGDGVLSDEERAAGSLGSATWLPPADFGASDEDTGVDSVAIEGCGNCSTGGVPSAGPLAALALLLVRRRSGRAAPG